MSSSTSCSSVALPQAARGRRGRSLRAAAFALLVAATLWITGELLESLAMSLDFDLLKVREMMSLQGETNDILYLGDSTTLDAVNPAVVDEILGTRSYNCASGQQRLSASEMILRHYLKNNARPRLIVYGLFVNSPRGGSHVNLAVYESLGPDLRRLYCQRMLEQRGNPVTWSDAAINSIKAYRYRDAIAYGIKYLIMGEKRRPKFVQGHLAIEMSRSIGSEAAREVLAEPPGIGGLLQYCADQRLPLLIFEPPNTPGYSADTKGRGEVLAYLQAGVRQDPLVAFRSFNDEGSLPYASDEWYVLNHLNAKGAIRFTREQLVPYIREFFNAGGDSGRQ
jgi:hypothetical protein